MPSETESLLYIVLVRSPAKTGTPYRASLREHDSNPVVNSLFDKSVRTTSAVSSTILGSILIFASRVFDYSTLMARFWLVS